MQVDNPSEFLVANRGTVTEEEYNCYVRKPLLGMFSALDTIARTSFLISWVTTRNTGRTLRSPVLKEPL